MTTLAEHLAAGRVTLTLAEAAEILGVHRQTASAAAARGEIPSTTLGTRVLILAVPLAEQLGVTADAPPDAPAVPRPAPEAAGKWLRVVEEAHG